MEVVTKAWRQDPAMRDGGALLQIKEKRPFGATRGNTSVPQAPELVVRIRNDGPGARPHLAVRAALWNFGPVAAPGSSALGPPSQSSGDGEPFVRLGKGAAEIACNDNVAEFGAPETDGFRYATLRCVMSRAAGVPCRRSIIALRLEAVFVHTDGGAAEVLAVAHDIEPLRTRRVSVSEKAMCPRACDLRKRGRSGSRGRAHSSSEDSSSGCSSSDVNEAGSSRKRALYAAPATEEASEDDDDASARTQRASSELDGMSSPEMRPKPAVLQGQTMLDVYHAALRLQHATPPLLMSPLGGLDAFQSLSPRMDTQLFNAMLLSQNSANKRPRFL